MGNCQSERCGGTGFGEKSQVEEEEGRGVEGEGEYKEKGPKA
jgi:hypothetical protein